MSFPRSWDDLVIQVIKLTVGTFNGVKDLSSEGYFLTLQRWGVITRHILIGKFKDCPFPTGDFNSIKLVSDKYSLDKCSTSNRPPTHPPRPLLVSPSRHWVPILVVSTGVGPGVTYLLPTDIRSLPTELSSLEFSSCQLDFVEISVPNANRYLLRLRIKEILGVTVLGHPSILHTIG